jgi:hypothetical protein
VLYDHQDTAAHGSRRRHRKSAKEGSAARAGTHDALLNTAFALEAEIARGCAELRARTARRFGSDRDAREDDAIRCLTGRRPYR